MLLLASEAPRSEHDPDPCACPEAAAANTAAANIAMNPVTGAFADPSHETACAAQLFRMALPCHAFLMALSLALIGWTSLSVPIDLWPLLSVLAFCITLGLVGRVLVHRMDDRVRGQRLGSWTWTVLLVLVVAIDVVGYVEREAQACGSVALQNERTIRCVVGALVNGSHGLGFGHKLGLIGLMLLDGLLAIAFCGEVALVGESMLVVGFVVAHLAEMHLRHSYVERVEKEQLLKEDQQEKRGLQERMEQLQTSNERLLYDNELQRRGRPLDDGDERSAIRRGLQAGPSQQPPTSDGDTSSSNLSGAKPSSDSAPPSLPPGPPSSTSSGSTAPPLTWAKPSARPPTWAELDAQYYAETAAKAAAGQGGPFGPSFAWTRPTAPPPTWAELGLPDDDPMRRAPPPSRAELAYRRHYAKIAAGPSQPYLSAASTDSSEAAGPAPSDARLPSLPPGKGRVMARSSHSSTGVEGTASARLSSASTACGEDTSGDVLAGASARQKQLAAEALAEMAMDEGAPSQRQQSPVPAHTYSLVPRMSSNQEVVIHINGAAPPSALQQRFDALVMCDFTPRSPSELPRPQWVSFPQLFHLFKPHAPGEVWPLGPGNLKQLIVAWYKSHPTFAGLEVDRWCTRFEAPPGTGLTFKFCFEHTPQ
eukprot:scaffold2960_cov61-Phaeocystis_antarctica.AAC.4